MAYSYSEITYRLSEETAIVVFRKKDNSLRVMLCTRGVRLIERMTSNPDYMVASLNGHDKRCNAANQNIAAIDLVIEAPRSFNIDRIVELRWLGCPQDVQQIGWCMDWYKVYKEFYDGYDDRSDVENYEVRQRMGL